MKRFDATKPGIFAAVKDIIAARSAESAEEAQSDDLFIFYFSGHGMISPADADEGRVLLSTKDTSLDPNSTGFEAATIRSTELLDLFEQIPGRKLILFDACRSLLPTIKGAAFDPTLIVSDLKNHAISANIFFSSDIGQASREVHEPAFDHNRPANRQGNGLFAYALLHALTTDATILGGVRSGLVEVRVLGLAQYFDTVFFNAGLPNGEARQLMKSNNWIDIQTPKFYPTRNGDSNQIVRSFLKTSGGR